MTWAIDSVELGSSPSACHQLPQEEVRTHQPAPPQEEAEIEVARLLHACLEFLFFSAGIAGGQRKEFPMLAVPGLVNLFETRIMKYES
jgi:hypothetical protein